MKPEQRQKLLRHIQFDQSISVDLSTLAQLQQRFLLTVPFENLDIHLGRKIDLDVESAFEKIVGQKRGGFCYECNALFKSLLDALGFESYFISARMARDAGQFAPEFGHIAIIVTLNDQQWLVDVGNGQSCREPLLLGGDLEFGSDGQRYRLQRYDDQRWAMMWRGADTEFQARFIFTDQAHPLQAFQQQCDFHQTSDLSPFTQKALITRALPKGERITLLQNRFTRTLDTGEQQQNSLSQPQIQRVLADEFGVQLQADEIQKIYRHS